MKTYTAHSREGRLPVLLREGWSWGAAFFGPIWLLAERAWIPALLELAVVSVVAVLASLPVWRPVVVGLFLFNGLLGRDLVRWSLERCGYALAAVVLAANRDAALLRLFAARPELLETAK